MGSRSPLSLGSPGAPVARVPLPSFLGAQRDKFPVPARGTSSGREESIFQANITQPRTVLPRLRSLSEEVPSSTTFEGRVGTPVQERKKVSRDSKPTVEHAKHAPQTVSGAPARWKFSMRNDRNSSPNKLGKQRPGENKTGEKSPLKTGSPISVAQRQLSLATQPSFAKQSSLRKQLSFMKQPSFKVSEINEEDFVEKVSGLETGEVPGVPELFGKLDEVINFKSQSHKKSTSVRAKGALSEHRHLLGIGSKHLAGGGEEAPVQGHELSFREGDIITIIGESLSFCERSAAETESQEKINKNMLLFTSDLHESFEPYGIEIGPVDINTMIQFCRLVRLKRAENPERHLVYTCMDDVLELRYEPDAACEPFVTPDVCPLVTFLDSSNKAGVSSVTVSDCVHAISKAAKAGWCEVDSFDVLQGVKTDLNGGQYEALSHPHGLDMHWICPKLVAFRQPSAPGMQRRIAKGAFTKCPDDYVQVFKKAGVAKVIRLKDNDGMTEEQYTPWHFARHGFAFIDIPCAADRMPSGKAIKSFFGVMDRELAVAVHCTSGLASTGTMIGLYLIKELGFSADEAVAWLRIVRPGSVLGPQHDFLRSCQHRVWKDGEMKGYQADAYPRTSPKEMEKLTNMLSERQWKRARNARHLDGDHADILLDLGVELESPLLTAPQTREVGPGTL